MTFLGSLIKGIVGRNANNSRAQYETDQARRDYEAQRAKAQEDDQRKLDGIDFLQAIAQGKGYNIPPAAFEALKRRGAYTGMPADQRVLTPPKQGLFSVLFNSVGDALNRRESPYAEFGGDAGGTYNPSPSAALRQGIDGGAGGDQMDIVSYYNQLANLGHSPDELATTAADHGVIIG